MTQPFSTIEPSSCGSMMRTKLLRPAAACIVLLVLFLSVSLTSCGRSQPKVFTFNYRISSPSNPQAIIQSITSGSTRIRSLLGNDPCNFTSSFASGFAPSVTFSGSPGQPGYLIGVASSNPSNLSTTNPAACPEVKSFNFELGASNEVINVGDTTDKGSFAIAFDNGSTFPSSTNRYFMATLDFHGTNPRRRNGSFSFVSLASPNKLLIGEGSYILRQ